MEEFLIGYTILSIAAYALLWGRGNKWHQAFLDKPVQRIVQAPKPEPVLEPTPPARVLKPAGDKAKALKLAKRMERVGRRTPAEKRDYMRRKLMRPGHLSMGQADLLIKEAYGLLR